jgi:hypothetical protein
VGGWGIRGWWFMMIMKKNNQNIGKSYFSWPIVTDCLFQVVYDEFLRIIWYWSGSVMKAFHLSYTWDAEGRMLFSWVLCCHILVWVDDGFLIFSFLFCLHNSLFLVIWYGKINKALNRGQAGGWAEFSSIQKSLLY